MASTKSVHRLTGLALGMGAVVALAFTAASETGEDADAPFPFPQGFKDKPNCTDCHPPGTEPIFPQVSLEAPQEVPPGTPFQVKLTLVGAWTGTDLEYLDVHAGIDLTAAPHLAFPATTTPLIVEERGRAIAPFPTEEATPHRIPFPVEAGPSRIAATVVAEERAWPVRDVRVRLVAPGEGRCFPECGGYGEEGGAAVEVPPEGLRSSPSGEWFAEVWTPAPLAFDPDEHTRSVPFTLTLEVDYDVSAVPQQVIKGPPRLGMGEPHTFTFQLVSRDGRGVSELLAAPILDVHYEHTDGGTRDLASVQIVSSATTEVGDGFVARDSNALAVLARDGSAALMRVGAEVVGFASSFILIPALVMGGTFGRGSVTFFNRVLGAPRRRVLWHGVMSYALLILSLAHMLLFLAEPRYAWDVGMVWGGLSLACMIGLALTGAFQRRLVKAWGFAGWRFAHFALGILILGTVILHLGVDGAHFDLVREALAPPGTAGP